MISTNGINAHDRFNALGAELDAMIARFERRYGWDAFNATGIASRVNTFEELLFGDGTYDVFGTHDASGMEFESDRAEMLARYRAVSAMRDGTESDRAFADMHDEYLDDLAGV